jgi:hypothetical protein
MTAMAVARSAKSWLAPVAKTLAPRMFWRRKYSILQRLGESRADIREDGWEARGVYVNNFVFLPKGV